MTYAALEAGKDMRPKEDSDGNRRLLQMLGKTEELEFRRLSQQATKSWSRKLVEAVQQVVPEGYFPSSRR
jgi:hypothetical protein